MTGALDIADSFGCGSRGDFYGALDAVNPLAEVKRDAVTGRPIVLAAYHGILTSDNHPTWPWDLQEHCIAEHPEIAVLTQHYWSFPFPRVNFWKNLRLARSLANRLAGYAQRGYEIHLVGHSNGGVIVLRAARMLAARGVRIESITLIASAVPSDVGTNGIRAMLADGRLGRVVCFYDPRDGVFRRRWWLPGKLQSLALWPYGRCGATGLTWNGKSAAGPRISQVACRGTGHTGYFNNWRGKTFARIVDTVLHRGTAQ